MLKQFYKLLNNKKSTNRGMVLALTLFVVAAAAVIVLVGLSSIFNRVNLDKYGGLAENAARTCLAELDNRLGTAAIDPYLICTSGQAFLLGTGAGCVNDLSDDANSVLDVGNNCDCAVFLESVGVTQYAVYADGRCYTPDHDRKQPIVRRVLTANVDLGTPANCYDAVGDVSGLTAVATSTNSTAGLNWTAVENATDYQICRSTDAGTCNSTTTFAATFTTANNYYVDTNVPYGTYYYTVRATMCSGITVSENVSNQEDIAMDCPLCQKYSGGACINQTDSEDTRDECSTSGCLTGLCNGSGACAVYNDTSQHNCSAGQNCYGGSCCITQTGCGGASGKCSGQMGSCGVNCTTDCTQCCKTNNYCGTTILGTLRGYIRYRVTSGCRYAGMTPCNLASNPLAPPATASACCALQVSGANTAVYHGQCDINHEGYECYAATCQ